MDTHSALRQELNATELLATALENGEGTLSDTGAIVVRTGERTGRSTGDRFIVRDSVTEDTVDWGAINRPIDPEVFEALYTKVREFLSDKPTYLGKLHVGADNSHYLPAHVETQYAWHGLFAQNIFRRVDDFNPKNKEVWKVVSAPEFVCDPARDQVNSESTLIINFRERVVLIAGLKYAGEMKKALFSVQNYLLPDNDVLPMHCSASISKEGNTTLFFGLSGTGKTTLSADPDSLLIGDDEHGWSSTGVFNFEGGCYAKCINLSEKHEPVIYKAIRSGAVLENVVVDSNGTPDYKDSSLTENTRCCYPLSHVDVLEESGTGKLPKAVVFLTCDVFGVMPPVSRLSREAAAYHFLSGYTALVGSTEVGSTEAIKSTFSTCFGAPFFPRPAQVYGDLLMRRIDAAQCAVYLVNTGWCGGAYGVGKRFDIPVTRSIVSAITSGELNDVETEHYAPLNLDVPVSVPGLEDRLRLPVNAWEDSSDYERYSSELVQRFRENIKRFDLSPNIVKAGPHG